MKITEHVRELFEITRYIPVKARRYMLHADENQATRCSESVIDTIRNRKRERQIESGGENDMQREMLGKKNNRKNSYLA